MKESRFARLSQPGRRVACGSKACFILALCLTAWNVAAATAALPTELRLEHPGRIVVLNMYYANPGKADEVLQTRLQASNIREQMGLPRGRVLKRINDAENLPDVMWACEYADIAAHDADMASRAGSDSFEGIRDRMRTVLQRFERTLWRVAHPADDGKTVLTAAGLPGASLPPGGIVVTNWYFAAAGNEQAVLDHRVHASDVRVQLGRPPGRVFARLLGTSFESSGELPGVMWQAEYKNLKDRRVDSNATAATTEFQAVMDHMGTLLRDFDRGVWEVQP